jgi:DNA-binding transcriptional ArsR family regulator
MRVPFTLDDLALTRFDDAPSPLCESFAGLIELRRRPAPPGEGRWAARARRAFPATARPLLQLIPASPPWPGFMDPLLPDLDDALEVVRATPRSVLREEVPLSWRSAARPPSWLRALADGDPESVETVVRALRDFYQACVAPCWPQIVATFRADIADRIPVLATGGLAAVLGTLHSDLTWRDNGLERSGRPGQFSLDGGGVKLIPSVLWTGPPVFASQPAELGGNGILYAAQPAPTASETGQSADLVGLLGRTRAAVLQALRAPLSTRELAASTGTSAPSASEHASALRAAGLVHTVRRGRSVSHSLTPLGRSLLNKNFSGH